MTFPHFETLFLGKETFSPCFKFKGMTSIIPETFSASDKPKTSFTVPGMLIQARSALNESCGISKRLKGDEKFLHDSGGR